MAVLRLVVCLLATPLLLFLPGYLLLQWLRRRRNADLPLADTIFHSILASTLLTSALALLLAEVGLFSLPLLLGLLAGLSLLLGLLLGRNHVPLRMSRPAWTDLLPLLLALLSAMLAARPFEYVLGSGDPGSYINIGVAIADSGGIILHNPEISQLQDAEFARRELLYADLGAPGLPQGYQHFPAMYIADQSTGTIAPQFYHLYPVWVAIGYSLFGLRGALCMAPLFGVLAMLAVYFAGKAIFGRWAGLLGSLFLGANLIQVWFSRYSTSEIPAQYWVFAAAGMLALYLAPRTSAADDGRVAEGVLAAGAMAALLHTRLDGLLALVPVVLWLLYLLLFRHRQWKPHLAFSLVLGAALVHLALYVPIFAGRYALRSVLALYSYLLRPALAISLAVAAVAGCLGLACLARSGWPARHATAVRVTLMLLLAGLAVWAYFVWPAITAPQVVEYPAYPEPVRFLFENDENLVRLGWYVTPWGLLLGFVGLLEAIRREPARRIAWLLAVFLIFGTLYTYQASDAPIQVHVMRRYVPAVIPTLALGAGYALQRLGQAARGRMGVALAGLLAAGLLALTALPTVPFLGYVEYAGAVDQVSQLAGRFDENALLLYDEPEYGVLLGMPLQYIFHLPGFTLQREHPDPAGLTAQLRAWESAGHEVYLIVTRGRSRLRAGDFALIPWGTAQFSLPRLEQVSERRPTQVVQLPFALEIYRLRPAGTSPANCEVDLGGADYAAVGEGFFSKEVMPEGETFRWTKEDAELLLPGPCFSSTQPISIELSLGHNRPPDVPPPEVEVWLEGRLLARLDVQFWFHTYEVLVPADLARELARRPVAYLHLRGDVWQPATSGIPDERGLGVFVDWIKVR